MDGCLKTGSDTSVLRMTETEVNSLLFVTLICL